MPDFSRAGYENLLYSLAERYPEISSSTLRLYNNSATTAFVRGSLYFHNKLELRVAETFPHHFHDPPDIKHNRRAAHGITFTVPNLPTLIADCIQLGQAPQVSSRASPPPTE